MISIYKATMDSDSNPLRGLPRAQQFQIMPYLSVMWTTVFCLASGAWFWYGELVMAHVLVALGFLITGLTFHRAKTGAHQVETTRSYRDYPAPDMTARCDDVWGA